jgi:hypothetical protein
MSQADPAPAPIMARNIPVALFREILIWPLALHMDADGDPQSMLRAYTQTVDKLTGEAREAGHWKPVDDPSEHIAAPEGDAEALARWREHRFAEGVYFHDFVQDYLYGRTKKRPAQPQRDDIDDAPFRLFRRTDITGVEVGLREGSTKAPQRTLTLLVERLNLYLFRTGAAVLVVEVSTNGQAKAVKVAGPNAVERQLYLSDVQDFHEQFRRAYIPYADSDGHPAGLVASSVRWLPSGKAREISKDTVEAMVGEFLDVAGDHPNTICPRRHAPILEHWRDVLDDALPLSETGPRKPGGMTWQHVVDERMPTLCTVSITGEIAGDEKYYYKRIHPDDIVRLCFADAANYEVPYRVKYDRRELKAFNTEHAYEVFRKDGSLYLCAGYSFVAVGAGSFFDTVVAPVHMRRHYFQLGLLAHLELASLLSYSARITRAVRDHKPNVHSDEDLERVMDAIENEYLQYVHRFHFTGASNHVQAQRISALWRKHLRLEDIFDDLHREITSATQYLTDRAATRSAQNIEGLTVIGLFGVIGAMTVATLSAPILKPDADPWAALCHLEVLASRHLPYAVLEPACAAAAAGQLGTSAPSLTFAEQAILAMAVLALYTAVAAVGIRLCFPKGKGSRARFLRLSNRLFTASGLAIGTACLRLMGLLGG